MNFSRRNFLRWAAETSAFSVVFLSFRVSQARDLPRPPGAVEEKAFRQFCTRCSRCIDVCQPVALKPAGFFDGWANVGTPIMNPNKCVLCMDCVRTCPTGALQKVPKKEVDIGTVIIHKDICWAYLRKKRCRICFEDCPLKAVEMERDRFPIVVEEKCNGCGICVRRCPTDPKAMEVIYRGAKRHPLEAKGPIIDHLPDRVGPYETPPPTYGKWFANRIQTLAESYIRKLGGKGS